MQEEQVTRAIVQFLSEKGWNILDYDFPGGGTGRKFHLDTATQNKTKGIVIPDVIAYRAGIILIFENKAKDIHSDYGKIKIMSHEREFQRQLNAAYPDKKIERCLFAVGFGGDWKFGGIAEECSVSLVCQVLPDFSIAVLRDEFSVL